MRTIRSIYSAHRIGIHLVGNCYQTAPISNVNLNTLITRLDHCKVTLFCNISWRRRQYRVRRRRQRAFRRPSQGVYHIVRRTDRCYIAHLILDYSLLHLVITAIPALHAHLLFQKQGAYELTKRLGFVETRKHLFRLYILRTPEREKYTPCQHQWSVVDGDGELWDVMVRAKNNKIPFSFLFPESRQGHPHKQSQASTKSCVRIL